MYSDEILRGCSRKHFQFSVFHGIIALRDHEDLCMDDLPSQEFAIFGRTILEDVSKTSLPCILYLFHYIRWVLKRITPVFDEIELYDREMLRPP